MFDIVLESGYTGDKQISVTLRETEEEYCLTLNFSWCLLKIHIIIFGIFFIIVTCWVLTKTENSGIIIKLSNGNGKILKRDDSGLWETSLQKFFWKDCKKHLTKPFGSGIIIKLSDRKTTSQQKRFEKLLKRGWQMKEVVI